jgi:hypothetical protein
MDWSSILVIGNIISTFIVGYILRSQIKSQKSIIENYKDFASLIDPKKVLSLKDDEIAQIKKNYSNDTEILQKQIYELSNYTNHVLNVFEKQAKEMGMPNEFIKESVVINNMPNCRNLLS